MGVMHKEEDAELTINQKAKRPEISSDVLKA